jgi:hypothetical protein
MAMDLTEPRWRIELKAAIASFYLNPPGADKAKAWAVISRYTEEHFDQLVQAIVRGDLKMAGAILHNHYPGSLERQDQIERALRGALDGP